MAGKTTNLLPILLWIAPMIVSTTYSHFKEGPPAKSWSLKYYLLITILHAYSNGPGFSMSSRQLQRISIQRTTPLRQDCRETEIVIPTEYREKGGKVLCNIFDAEDETMIGWNWQADRNKATTRELQGSWIEPISQRQQQQRTLLYLHGGNYFLGTYKLYRGLLGDLVISGDARVLAIDYRLAPQHPFPTALEDALAAYMYLLDPPEDALLAPVPSSQIVLSGDSSGGGLTMALLQVIRDTGLPMPAGGMLISPWIDLMHSLPSCQDNEITDYLPPLFNQFEKSVPSEKIISISQQKSHQQQQQQSFDSNYITQSNEAAYHHTTTNLIKKKGITSYCGLFLDDTVDQLHHYTLSRCLKHPLVSPIFDKYRWHGLPPLLIQAGDAEQLRDESIYASFMATDQFDATPPALNTTTHKRLLKPTMVTLDLYDDQPHVFQILMPSKAVRRSVLEMASFLHDITLTCITQAGPHPLTIRSVSADGWIDDVTEDMLKIHDGDIWLNWQDRLDNSNLKSRLNHAVAARL